MKKSKELSKDSASKQGAGKKKKVRGRICVRLLSVLLGLFVFFTASYAFVVYSNIPFIAYWRTIWIETAMSTKSHQWLAEWFFPDDVVDAVLADKITGENVVGGADNLLFLDGSAGYDENAFNDPSQPDERPADILGQKDLKVGEKDSAGNTVLINDIDEGLVVCEIVGNNYKGQIMLIDDPARVYLGMTLYPGETGMRILDMMEHYDAVAGVNASGFYDPNENGNGGQVLGLSLSEGRYWGEFIPTMGSIVLTRENKLAVGDIQAWNRYSNIRDGMQFGPVLIADGVKKVSGSSGYGLQPRTAVGQRADGVIVFIVIDGRDITHSIGCTVDDLAEELLKYDIINASCCDGGATTALAYGGKVLNKNCSWNPSLGRILPNAFLVRSKADME